MAKKTYYQMRVDWLGKQDNGNIHPLFKDELLTSHQLEKYHVPEAVTRKLKVESDRIYWSFGTRRIIEGE